MLVAEGTGDYAFLSLKANAFDLTERILQAQRDFAIRQAQYQSEIETQKARAEQAGPLSEATSRQAVVAEEVRVERTRTQEQIAVQEQEVMRRQRELEADPGGHEGPFTRSDDDLGDRGAGPLSHARAGVLQRRRRVRLRRERHVRAANDRWLRHGAVGPGAHRAVHDHRDLSARLRLRARPRRR